MTLGTTNVAAKNRPAAHRHLGNRCLVLVALLAIVGQTLPAKAQAILKKAVFAKALAQNQAPVNPSNDFYPTDTIYLSLQIKGRPSKGIVAAKFYLGSQLITTAQVDVAEINHGVLFSVGTDTFVGFTLHPNSPLPVSDTYRAETSFNGKPWGIYRFRVTPPAGTIPARIISAALAKAVDANRLPVGPTSAFGPHQPAYLALHGALGNGTTIAANWFVNGKLDPAGTKSLTASKNVPDTHFYFAFLPKGGWPAGKHEVVLILNGKEAGRYPFTAK